MEKCGANILPGPNDVLGNSLELPFGGLDIFTVNGCLTRFSEATLDFLQLFQLPTSDLHSLGDLQ